MLLRLPAAWRKKRPCSSLYQLNGMLFTMWCRNDWRFWGSLSTIMVPSYLSMSTCGPPSSPMYKSFTARVQVTCTTFPQQHWPVHEAWEYYCHSQQQHCFCTPHTFLQRGLVAGSKDSRALQANRWARACRPGGGQQQPPLGPGSCPPPPKRMLALVVAPPSKRMLTPVLRWCCFLPCYEKL